MMDWTDRHCRVFHRALTSHAWLYTEMLTAPAVIHGDREKLLGFNPCEHPLALQLGGSDPKLMARAARIGEQFGYNEINLNIGCPSDRVKQGHFGACLMAEPDLVARLVSEIRAAVVIPVTVKCRIGIDDQNTEVHFRKFIEKVHAAGCETFIIHARKAWLKGLSPKQNRDIPPLDYDRVYRLKATMPDLKVIINGGITDLIQAEKHLAYVDGVMLGRAAYQMPYLLSAVDELFYAEPKAKVTAHQCITKLFPYIEKQLHEGIKLHQMTRHMTGLFQGVPGARAWRRVLSEQAIKPGADLDTLQLALEQIKSPYQMA